MLTPWLFRKDHCLIKNYFDYFLGTFRETWAIFILTSGHTDRKSPKLRSTVPHNQCGQIVCSLFGQLGSNFCKLLNKCSKDCQIDYNFCQSGEISPNPVTLPIINITDMRIDLTTFEQVVYGPRMMMMMLLTTQTLGNAT